MHLRLFWLIFAINILGALSSSAEELKFNVKINVRELGAIGDGKHDDTFVIQKAIDSASLLKGGYVFFPDGVYMISSIDVKVSMKGRNNTVIKNIKTDLVPYKFVNVRNISGIKLEKIKFDGSVTISNDGEVLSGSIPLFLYNCKNIEIENCNFIRSPMSGLRVEDCENISVKGCNSQDHIGVFGDGYYFSLVKNSKIENSFAENYTRIGFVTESNSSNIKVLNCVARNGNSASILKGGSEFNAGFWYENSGNITTINCKAENNTHRGFVATTGRNLSKIITDKRASFIFENCESKENPIGFVVASAGYPADFSLNKCRADNVSTGFFINARNSEDRFYFKNCSVLMNELPEKSLNNVGFNWESTIKESTSLLPKVILKNCHIEYLNPNDLTKLLNRNSNSGDISTYGGGHIDIEINKLTNSLIDQPVIIKARRGNPKYKISGTNYNHKFLVPNK